MRGTITLKNPIKIDGKIRKEFKYDTEEITTEHFVNADSRAQGACARNGAMSLAVVETNVTMQTYLGMYAIIAVNHDIDITDLERIKGSDSMQLYRIGRDFMKGNAEDEEDKALLTYEESTSEEQSEDTAEPSIAK